MQCKGETISVYLFVCLLQLKDLHSSLLFNNILNINQLVTVMVLFLNIAVKMFSVRDQNAKGMSNSFIKQLMKGCFRAKDCQDKPWKLSSNCNVIM